MLGADSPIKPVQIGTTRIQEPNRKARSRYVRRMWRAASIGSDQNEKKQSEAVTHGERCAGIVRVQHGHARRAGEDPVVDGQ